MNLKEIEVHPEQVCSLIIEEDVASGFDNISATYINLTKLDIEKDKGNTFLNLLPKLPALKELRLKLVYGDTIPDVIWTYTSLISLVIEEATSVYHISPKINQLHNLQELHLRSCLYLNSLPIDSKKLTKLKVFELNGKSPSNRYVLPDTFLNGSMLDELVLKKGWHEQSLKFIERFQTLKRLELSEGYMKKIPRGIFELQNLQELDLHWNFAFSQIPEEIKKLSNLKNLDLSGDEKIKSLPTGLCHLNTLEKLNLDNMTNLRMLPDSFGNLIALTELKMKACCRIIRIPASFGKLTKIKKLELCLSGEKLPDSFKNLSSIEFLSLINSRNLNSEEVVKIVASCKKLDTFYVTIKENKLSDVWSTLKNIHVLGIKIVNPYFDWKSFNKINAESGSIQLKINSAKINLPDLLTSLKGKRIKSLSMEGCNIRAVPAEIEMLLGIEKLVLANNKIEFIHPNIGKLLSLKILDLRNQADNFSDTENSKRKMFLKTLPDEITKLVQLKELILYGNNEIPADFIARLKTVMSGCEILF